MANLQDGCFRFKSKSKASSSSSSSSSSYNLKSQFYKSDYLCNSFYLNKLTVKENATKGKSSVWTGAKFQLLGP